MKLVLDLETQNSFQEIGGKSNLALLKISVVGAYWYGDGRYYTFGEGELDKLEEFLKKAELVIGFNLVGFDYPVLQNYLKNFNFSGLRTLDIMVDAERYLGYKIKLEDVAQGSLNIGKSGTGLDAIKFWKENSIDKLKKYCLKDVEVTKNIYEYGVQNKEIKFKSLWEKYPIPVDWY